MKSKKTASIALIQTAAITLLFATQPALASVGASYTGTIDQDSGLGLLGQTMRVDLTYDELAPIDFTYSNGNSFWYNDVIESMTISIGANVWIFNTNVGASNASLHNDDLIVSSVGIEDRLNFDAYTFSGPSIAPLPVDDGTYGFRLGLSDNSPTGAPDGLSTKLTLPVSAPDPALFNTPDGVNGSNNQIGRAHV